MRLLVVEDEPSLREDISTWFRERGYEVDSCADGMRARDMCLDEEYDLVLLDLGLPGCDGTTVLQALRSIDTRTPVLILSARGQIADKVGALDLGANDYLTKPFHLEELGARVRSLTRRRFEQYGVVIRCGQIDLDTTQRIVTANGRPLSLTRKETSLLEYLIMQQGRMVTQEELMEHVWDLTVPRSSNVVRVHISALRKKLRVALGYDPITNSVGHGYMISEQTP